MFYFYLRYENVKVFLDINTYIDFSSISPYILNLDIISIFYILLYLAFTTLIYVKVVELTISTSYNNTLALVLLLKKENHVKVPDVSN